MSKDPGYSDSRRDAAESRNRLLQEENIVLKSILLEVSKQLLPYASIGGIEHIRSEISRGLRELDE